MLCWNLADRRLARSSACWQPITNEKKEKKEGGGYRPLPLPSAATNFVRLAGVFLATWV
jgi:hypothetical protein